MCILSFQLSGDHGTEEYLEGLINYLIGVLVKWKADLERRRILMLYVMLPWGWQKMQRLKGLLYDKIAQRKNAWEYSIILYGIY